MPTSVCLPLTGSIGKCQNSAQDQDIERIIPVVQPPNPCMGGGAYSGWDAKLHSGRAVSAPQRRYVRNPGREAEEVEVAFFSQTPVHNNPRHSTKTSDIILSRLTIPTSKDEQVDKICILCVLYLVSTRQLDPSERAAPSLIKIHLENPCAEPTDSSPLFHSHSTQDTTSDLIDRPRLWPQAFPIRTVIRVGQIHMSS
jgi:hypothetical protein